MYNKGSGIFLGIIGVATLVVAIIGATFAYFSASAASNNDAIQAESTELKLGYSDVTTGLKDQLIPAGNNIALAGANSLGRKGGAANTVGSTTNTMGQCIDDQGNEVCGIYVFTIGNPSFGTTQSFYASLKVTSNAFENLYFTIYEGAYGDDIDGAIPINCKLSSELATVEGEEKEENNCFGDANHPVIVPPTKIGTATDGNLDEVEDEGIINLNQYFNGIKLGPSSLDIDNRNFDDTDPDTYTFVSDNPNKRTYTLIIWIKEIGTDQTDADSAVTFTGGLKFTTTDGNSGVTGVIAAAQQQTPVGP